MIGIDLHFWPSIKIDFFSSTFNNIILEKIVDPVFMLARSQFFPLLKRKLNH